MQRYQISSQMATEISSGLSLTRCRQPRKVSIHDDLSNGSFILKDISVIVSNDLVKLLGIAIDVKLNFCLHVGSFLKCWTLLLIPSLRFLCTLPPFATRPCVNWILWPKYLIVLDLSDRKTIYESSVEQQVETSLRKYERGAYELSTKIVNHPMRGCFKRQIQSHFAISRLRLILLGMYKCLGQLNVRCTNGLFEVKSTSYSLKTPVKFRMA